MYWWIKVVGKNWACLTYHCCLVWQPAVFYVVECYDLTDIKRRLLLLLLLLLLYFCLDLWLLKPKASSTDFKLFPRCLTNTAGNIHIIFCCLCLSASLLHYFDIRVLNWARICQLLRAHYLISYFIIIIIIIIIIVSLLRSDIRSHTTNAYKETWSITQ